jgi:hypothetical protein
MDGQTASPPLDRNGAPAYGLRGHTEAAFGFARGARSSPDVAGAGHAGAHIRHGSYGDRQDAGSGAGHSRHFAEVISRDVLIVSAVMIGFLAYNIVVRLAL